MKYISAFLFVFWLTSSAMAQSTFTYQGKTLHPDKRNFFVDAALNDNDILHNSYTFHSLKEALRAAEEQSTTNKVKRAIPDKDEKITIYIAPSVYWLDNPDNPEVFQPLPGENIPYGMKLKVSNLPVVRETETIAGEWQNVTSESLNISGPYQLRLEIDITKDGTFSLANESGEYLEIFVSATTGKLVTHRTGNTGLISFASNYAIPTIKSPFNTEGDKIILDIFVDQSSVEIFTQNGSMAQTNLIFPRSIYNRLQTTDMELKAQIRPLDNIWM